MKKYDLTLELFELIKSFIKELNSARNVNDKDIQRVIKNLESILSEGWYSEDDRTALNNSRNAYINLLKARKDNSII